MTDNVRKYLASIGSKGGKTTGKSKVRGDADYYRRISQKAAEARKRKREGNDVPATGKENRPESG